MTPWRAEAKAPSCVVHRTTRFRHYPRVPELYPQIEPYDEGMLDVGDGQRVHWSTSGNPDGLPAVLLHGGPGSGSTPGLRRVFDPRSTASSSSTSAAAA